MFDFTSLYENGKKLLVKKVIVHYMGYGDCNIVLSDRVLTAKLNQTKVGDAWVANDPNSVGSLVDDSAILKETYNDILTNVYAVDNPESSILRISTESVSLRLLEVKVVAVFKSIEQGEQLVSYQDIELGTGGGGGTVPGGSTDENTEDYDFDFGDIV